MLNPKTMFKPTALQTKKKRSNQNTGRSTGVAFKLAGAQLPASNYLTSADSNHTLRSAFNCFHEIHIGSTYPSIMQWQLVTRSDTIQSDQVHNAPTWARQYKQYSQIPRNFRALPYQRGKQFLAQNLSYIYLNPGQCMRNNTRKISYPILHFLCVIIHLTCQSRLKNVELNSLQTVV